MTSRPVSGIKVVFTILIGVVLVASGLNCEKFAEENYSISPFDQNACSILQRQTGDTLRIPAAEIFNPDWVPRNVPAHVPELLDSLYVRHLIVREGENNYVLFPPAAVDTSFICLVTESEKVTVFLSDVLHVALLNERGEVIEPVAESIPFETAAECPYILARLVYMTPAGRYLMLLGLNDRVQGESVRATVLGGS